MLIIDADDDAHHKRVKNKFPGTQVHHSFAIGSIYVMPHKHNFDDG